MNAVVTQPAFAELIPAAKPTLRELALLAIRARDAARNFVPGTVYWTEAQEREQDRLDDAAFDARQAMLAAFAEAGFDQKLLVEIGDVAL